MKDTEQAETHVINQMPSDCHSLIRIFIRRHDGGIINIADFRYLVWNHLMVVGGMPSAPAEKLTLELIEAMG